MGSEEPIDKRHIAIHIKFVWDLIWIDSNCKNNMTTVKESKLLTDGLYNIKLLLFEV